MVRRLELSRDAHVSLLDACRAHGITFMSTAFDQGSLDLLIALGVERLKIPSGDITNLPLLRYVGSRGLPVILSTGMATIGEVETALGVLEVSGTPRERITVLHCTTEYPAPFRDVNLNAMITLRDALKVSIGYSDHTPGIEVPIAAVALGATVIEKHLTLDRSLPGPDHHASLDPGEFAHMVRAIRHVEAALGDGIKRMATSEAGNRTVARRSIVAATPIAAGERFTIANLAAKRPRGASCPTSRSNCEAPSVRGYGQPRGVWAPAFADEGDRALLDAEAADDRDRHAPRTGVRTHLPRDRGRWVPHRPKDGDAPQR